MSKAQNITGAIFLLLPLGVLIALLTPDNILDHPWARTFTDFMASWNPFVAEIGQWSPIPSNQFCAAVINLLAMLLSFPLFYLNLRPYMLQRLSGMSKKKSVGFLFSGLFSFVVCFYILFLLPAEHELTLWTEQAKLYSKLGMGIVGSMIIISGWGGMMMGLSCIELCIEKLCKQKKG